MLKTQKLTPEVYYKESRDFQFFGRLYDSVFNYLKTEIDLVKTFPLQNKQDTAFVELLLKTLGFRNLREYQTDQLIALASVWTDLIRNKGSRYAIDMLVRTILRAENISSAYDIQFDDTTKDFPTVIIKIKDLISSQESALLEEVLSYILPVGTAYIIQDISLMNNFTPMSITLEENTSVSKVDRKEISSLARDRNTEETAINNGNGYTGTFKDKELTQPIKKGSIKIGTLDKKKE